MFGSGCSFQLLAGGIWLSKRDTQPDRGLQRLFFLAVTGFFCPLLFTFWPLVSKQDFLPYYPLLMLAITWPLVRLGEWIRSKTGWPIFLPPLLIVCWQLASIVQSASAVETNKSKECADHRGYLEPHSSRGNRARRQRPNNLPRSSVLLRIRATHSGTSPAG